MTTDKISWKGVEYSITWKSSKDCSKLDKKKIKQVYAVLFDNSGSICLVRPTKERGWRLPGGRPELEDKNWKETAIREANEEADIEIKKEDLLHLGYIKAITLDKKEELYIRCCGKISKINEQTEDPAEDLINERIFIKPEQFLEYCPWGDTGKVMIDSAIKIIEKKLK